VCANGAHVVTFELRDTDNDRIFVQYTNPLSHIPESLSAITILTLGNGSHVVMYLFSHADNDFILVHIINPASYNAHPLPSAITTLSDSANASHVVIYALLLTSKLLKF